jgi:hypothetical protein
MRTALCKLLVIVVMLLVSVQANASDRNAANYKLLAKETLCKSEQCTNAEMSRTQTFYQVIMLGMTPTYKTRGITTEDYAVNTAILIERQRAEIQRCGGYEKFCAEYPHTLAPWVLATNVALIYHQIKLGEIGGLPANLKEEYRKNVESGKNAMDYEFPSLRPSGKK